ncbi:MAG: M48 family metalloprotease [Chloracidobacterium sp.]|nr:M48 family metalloprotease [Chloracidobacterium sp.]
MFELLGICLALASLLTLNALTALLASAVWSAIRSRAESWPAAARSQFLFALRVFPAVIAIVCVTALFLPAYIMLEPRRAVEPVSLKLSVLAAISAAGLLLALWRGVAAWIATHTLIRNWLRAAEPAKLIGFDQIPIYRLRHQFPVVAVVGAVRPKLFIADQLFQSLTREEMSAAIAHESGHIAARDNLKRAALRICRDALSIFPFGASLDRAWAESAESAADEHAVRVGGVVALDLASTLIKIARLAPRGNKPAMPAVASLIINDADGIAKRVRRLTQLATHNNLNIPSHGWTFKIWTCFVGILASAILLASSQSALLTVHKVIEMAVSKLQ